MNSSRFQVALSPIGLATGFARFTQSSVFLATLAEPRQGMATADNERFLRRWFEVASLTKLVMHSVADRLRKHQARHGFPTTRAVPFAAGMETMSS